MEYVIWKQRAVSPTKTSSIVLIREGQDVVAAEVVLANGADVAGYVSDNLAALYLAGRTPSEAEVSPLALFNAAKGQGARAIYLAAIFSAFYQLQIGGGAAEMIAAARSALAANDEVLAAATAFEQAFKAASEDQQDSLVAMGVYLAGMLVSSK